MMRVLILGGTGDAAELAARLATIESVEIITSLAGRTREPLLPLGDLRVGGFGGVAGLVSYLEVMQIDLLIDATHPFATQISWNAVDAATKVRVPHLMLIRPPWEKVNDDRWIEVDSVAAAATVLQNQAQRVFLTVGRQELAAFAHLKDIWFLMRMIDPPAPDALVPPGMLLCDRGPFTLQNEREILIQHNIDTIVSKNSGGDATYAKIIAARELEVKVVMVNRPPIPPGNYVTNVDDALAWVFQKINYSI
ncbi:cobalt-precorrin-6X reductase [Nostoc linckia z18]|uniref:Cobalt-precorrin-6X reductase n=3 Tax=Nostoc linckia TaxID=92942 RepID=A0A9Q6EHW9_NOSLI|nr:cobalt-precorrin-6X reductase [Nostoc linckia z1]PHJ56733.1 cobalt-precorrin-6X reductase [Nostoc linckia z3]PHJ57741.1 cobalt-precorrin-6X reductase [Nostoc linckia z2]PHJ72180.1 cobalt-precorrin-6X reductase [Nostoc linckia z4]PHJ76659.1 cobalt-precorrin-6X reductase [Nostoc linckia z6]PHJ85948.1 cobalt-precorrin-6X reductase [Nostoc linckia z7]PHJ93484.1 cobalt-precorrin-6X reductase [Nostoc linckia z8]PHK09829.1 cobalt-precorrin-6X reductase [Nostoc linckia z9]PHK12877.1 cobalt-preco